MRTARTRGRAAVAAAAAAPALALSACGEDTAGPEVGTTVEDIQEDAASDVGPFEGVYDSDFSDDIESYEGREVRVSADVNEVLSPTAFTIAGTDDTTVDELLVVGAEESNNLAPDLTVAVEGTVRLAFDLAEAEAELGADLDDALGEEWAGEPYIVAESIDTSVPSDQ
ncbi:hypothetical protein E4P41_14115 [Geodermatophilus sp. DF01-2]|uniref:hypothetical protein n=1 Tax=Geodermatophilus sp. DF01-2 TaxID=2559610 RepID=UPI001073AD4B|nr:hypothetical protein [Geodermatophilus sp. DF01_2]TFV57718.1 hypothetical protein E4P41_14115 [Geodermatophilus sp. DF01_2]